MNYPYFIPVTKDGLEGIIVNRYGNIALSIERRNITHEEANALINALQTVLQDEEEKR